MREIDGGVASVLCDTIAASAYVPAFAARAVGKYRRDARPDPHTAVAQQAFGVRSPNSTRVAIYAQDVQSERPCRSCAQAASHVRRGYDSARRGWDAARLRRASPVVVCRCPT